jgi:hypothetical protein
MDPNQNPQDKPQKRKPEEEEDKGMDDMSE